VPLVSFDSNRSGVVACDECGRFATGESEVSESAWSDTDATALAMHFRDVDDAVRAATRAGWECRANWRCPACLARQSYVRVATK
jgi:hypothetical protein